MDRTTEYRKQNDTVKVWLEANMVITHDTKADNIKSSLLNMMYYSTVDK